MYDIPYMRNLKRNDTNELTKQTLRDLENELAVAEGRDREFGKVMYTLLCSKWIPNKDLLYSTWNSAQSSLDGKGFWGRMDTGICMLSPFTVHLKLPQH